MLICEQCGTIKDVSNQWEAIGYDTGSISLCRGCASDYGFCSICYWCFAGNEELESESIGDICGGCVAEGENGGNYNN